jgi:hypothetical protein
MDAIANNDEGVPVNKVFESISRFIEDHPYKVRCKWGKMRKTEESSG